MEALGLVVGLWPGVLHGEGVDMRGGEPGNMAGRTPPSPHGAVGHPASLPASLPAGPRPIC